MLKIIFIKDNITPIIYATETICRNESELFLTFSVSRIISLLLKTSKLSMMKKYSGICPEIFIEIKGNTNAKTDIVSNIMRQTLNLLHLPNNNLYV